MKQRILTGLLAASLLLLAACGQGPQGDGAAAGGENEPDSAVEQAGENDGGDTQDNPDTAEKDKGQDEENDIQDNEEEAPEMSEVGNYTVEIEIQDYGTITVALDASAAPITVENFVSLIQEGFYDGLTFHRIISGFMIQGGDPLGNGTGGSEQNIKGEFAANGVNNTLSHTRGAISMARSQLMDSASSQFFIVHEDSQFLDGQYAAFGYVTSGMEVVDAICEATPVQDENGTVSAKDQPTITAIRIVE